MKGDRYKPHFMVPTFRSGKRSIRYGNVLWMVKKGYWFLWRKEMAQEQLMLEDIL
ncbi:9939_t:CDS:1, partial [Racocetra persica]